MGQAGACPYLVPYRRLVRLSSRSAQTSLTRPRRPPSLHRALPSAPGIAAINTLPNPLQAIHLAAIRPFLKTRAEPRDDRVLAEIGRLLLVVGGIAKAVVKAVSLPNPRIPRKPRAGPRLPEFHSVFNRSWRRDASRRAEEMQMVRQDDVVTDQPGAGLVLPNLVEGLRELGGGKDAPSLSRGDGEEDQGRSAETLLDPCAACCLPTGFSSCAIGAGTVGRVGVGKEVRARIGCGNRARESGARIGRAN